MTSPVGPQLQRAAEAQVLARTAAALEVELAPATLALPGGATVDIDGVDPAQSTFVEVFVRQGRLKGPQLDKVARDALKLATLGRSFASPRLVIAFADPVGAGQLAGSSWLAEALRTWRIQALVVGLDDELAAALRPGGPGGA